MAPPLIEEEADGKAIIVRGPGGCRSLYFGPIAVNSAQELFAASDAYPRDMSSFPDMPSIF